MRKIVIPPLKIQGMKTKLVDWILENISYNNNGIYYEPFMGSGIVGFNLQPKRAIFSDINPHIINFYNSIKSREINEFNVRDFLKTESIKLNETSVDKNSYYYKVRERFNKSYNSLDFLFLNKTCFSGIIRFNKGRYNVPFCRYNDSLTNKKIDKIALQVRQIYELISKNDYTFICEDYKTIFNRLTKNDFVYLDPPYIGRNTDYYTKFDEDSANKLVELVNYLDCNYAISMWYEDEKNQNPYIDKFNGSIILKEHLYKIGRSENRPKVLEALIISNNINIGL